MQAIRFMHELGSIQYFDRDGLREKIIVNPQWIINVMACIISVQKNAIQVYKIFINKLNYFRELQIF